MQHGAVFGEVDTLATQHAVAPALDIGLAYQIEQEIESFRFDALAREIEQQVVAGKRKTPEAALVAFEHRPQMPVAQAGRMGGKCAPGGGLVYRQGGGSFIADLFR